MATMSAASLTDGDRFDGMAISLFLLRTFSLIEVALASADGARRSRMVWIASPLRGSQ
jgi:hypothetical protein